MNATEARAAATQNAWPAVETALSEFDTLLSRAVKAGRLTLRFVVTPEVYPFFRQELMKRSYWVKDITAVSNTTSVYAEVGW